ncbi:MAG TPA: hypothetical protein VK929_16995 [Longimicrobiales bacterium]|nr:hypothetical protein [Longimicrobiales bacterium]
MKRCAFLTTDDLTGFVTDDALAIGPLQHLGWQVDQVPWRADADWDSYDVVIVRSTWDYQDHPDAFDVALRRIDGSRALLLNPLPLMRWNMRKTYLRELGAQGVPLLPTIWGDGISGSSGGEATPGVNELRGLFHRLDSDEIVIKPVVGANADHAWRVRRDADITTFQGIAQAYHHRPYLAQPFQRRILDEGEFSLIYVAGELSHTILKTPTTGDFRVQEEHGGIITAVRPESTLRHRGDQAMAALQALADPTAAPFYARADFVRTDTGDFAIMELELIEPALYFRMDDGAADRFARAVSALIGSPVPYTIHDEP